MESYETRAHPDFGLVERWNDAVWDPVRAVVSYETHYRVPDGQVFSARSEIAFPSFADLSGRIKAAGLAAEYWAGDPRGGPLRAGSADFIPIGGRAADVAREGAILA